MLFLFCLLHNGNRLFTLTKPHPLTCWKNNSEPVIPQKQKKKIGLPSREKTILFEEETGTRVKHATVCVVVLWQVQNKSSIAKLSAAVSSLPLQKHADVFRRSFFTQAFG